ncbi:MAG: hypothetical protein K0S74_569 [Chlamydiales bacterium]|jgi:hypothetical protein|nr:hypothetical protein [Chlamydiales bacterium]
MNPIITRDSLLPYFEEAAQSDLLAYHIVKKFDRNLFKKLIHTYKEGSSEALKVKLTPYKLSLVHIAVICGEEEALKLLIKKRFQLR